MRRRGVAAAAFIACTLGCQGKADRTAVAGAEPPNLAGPTLDGPPLALADLRGRVVLVNVWATWCPPCREELPELQRLHEQHESAGLSIVGVSIDKPNKRGAVRALADETGVTFPIVLDPDGESVGTFDVIGYPTTILLGRDGRERWRRMGIIGPGDDEVATQLRIALGESAPAQP